MAKRKALSINEEDIRIRVTKVKEYADGSALVTFDMTPEAKDWLICEGILSVLKNKMQSEGLPSVPTGE